MTRRNIAIIVVLSAVAAATGGTIAGRWNSPKREVAPELQPALFIDAKNLDFGDVWETDKFEWQLNVENRGAGVVEVIGLSGSCSCLSIEPNSFTLPSGGTQTLRLTIDLTANPTPTGQISLTVTAMTNRPGDTGSARWGVIGRVKQLLVSDGRINFGKHSVLAQPISPLVIPLTSAVPLESLRAECSSPLLSVKTQPTDNSAQSYTVVLRPVGAFQPGPIEFIVTLKPVGVGGPLPIRRVLIQGSIVEDVEAEPGEVLGGGRLLGESFAEEVALRSLTDRPILVESVVAEGSGLSVDQMGTGNRVRVRQTAVKEGNQTTRVVFMVRTAQRADPFRVEAVVQYTGIRRVGK